MVALHHILQKVQLMDNFGITMGQYISMKIKIDTVTKFLNSGH